MRKYGDFFAEHSGVESEYKRLFTLLRLSHVSAKQLTLIAQYVGEQPALLAKFIKAIQIEGASHVPQLYPVGYHHHLHADISMILLLRGD